MSQWMPPHRVGPAHLTEREIQVLTLMAEGKSNLVIGKALFLSEETIKTHLRRLYRKFGVDNRIEAMREGIKRGVIPCACQRRFDQALLEAMQKVAEERERDVLAQNNRAPGTDPVLLLRASAPVRQPGTGLGDLGGLAEATLDGDPPGLADRQA